MPLDRSGVQIQEGVIFQSLKEYNFFTGAMNDQMPNDAVLPYDLNTPLFSDYALKSRFIYVPEGKIIPYNSTDVLDLPVGSALIKTFYYNTNGANRLIETRLLIHNSNGWHPETYIWNEAQTDAVRSLIGGTIDITINHNNNNESFSYLIPNQNQCVNCHASSGQTVPIGIKVPNLNRLYNYAQGSANQIQKWVDQGFLAANTSVNIPAWPSFSDPTADLNEKARAYLEVNCASCHTSAGSAANSGLFLEYSNTNMSSLGVLKTPVAAGSGSGGFNYVIDPGNANSSILLYRMNSSAVDVRMPEIGRSVIHDEGVNLIEEWINSL